MIGVYRTQGGRYEWGSLINDAIEAGGRWVLLEVAAPVRLAKRINDRDSNYLRRADVALEARVVNEHEHNGQRQGDIYVRLRPQE